MTERDEPIPDLDGPLSDRLRASADAFEPRRPEVEKILSRGRTRRWVRRAGIATGSLMIVAGVLAPLGLLSGLGDAPAGTTPGGPHGSKLVFGSLIDDRYVLSTANGDGSAIRQLPIPITIAIDPDWSPDGSQIVFSGDERGNTEPGDLYLVDADGSALRRLTDDPAILDWDPAWSPDGTTIAFVRASGPGEPINEHRVATLDIDTGHIEILPFDGYQASDPAWSPDGSKIAFTGNVEGLGNIFVMDTDGSNVERLTRGTSGWSDSAPAWSPDGTTIAFDRLDESSGSGERVNVDIYVMGADGSSVTQVTSSQGFEAAPAWSPDGSRLAFIGLIADATGWTEWWKSELYTMRPDGSDVARLTTGAATGSSPNGFAAPAWVDASNSDALEASPPPSMTEGTGEAAWRESDAGVTYADLQVQVVPGMGLGLVGDVSWTGDKPPPESACQASFSLAEGGTEKLTFITGWVPSGDDVLIVRLPDAFRGATPLGVQCGGGLTLGSTRRSTLHVGDTFGDFQGLTLSSSALDEARYRRASFPGELEIAFFWASGLPGSQEYLASLEQIDVDNDQVSVLGVDVHDEDEAARAAMDAAGAAFVTIADRSGELARRFGIYSLPVAVAVDGETKKVLAVFEDADPQELEAFVSNWLSSDRPGSP